MAQEKAGSAGTVKKGRIAKSKKRVYLYTSKGLYPIEALQKYEEGRAESKQIGEADDKWLDKKGLMPHPFQSSVLLDFQENNTYFDACVKQIARDVSTPGWRMVAIEEGKEDEDQKRRAEDFFNDPNDRNESMGRVIERLISDWGAIGWLAIEHGRGPDGMTNGIWHVPAHTIYKHKDRKRYAQIRGQKKIWFKDFGLQESISKITGEALKSAKNDANEIVWYTNYYAKSDYYGAPNILPATAAIIGMLGVRNYNLAFFENYGVPAGLVTLEGEWEDDAADDIRDFIDAEIRGSESAHKTIVLEAPDGCKATWQALSVELKEGSFTLYTKDLRMEILVAYRMPPYRIGMAELGALGQNVAKEMTEIYNQSIVGPLKNDIGDLITRTILKQGLEIDKYKFELIPLDIRDLERLTIIWDRLFKLAVINADWIRSQMGEDEREDGMGGEYYISSALLPVTGETVEKREHAMDAWMEDTSLAISERIKTLEEAQKKIDARTQGEG